MSDIGLEQSVRISVSVDGSGHEDGQTVYLLTEKVQGPYKSLMKITQSAAGISFSSANGKRDWPVKLLKCYVHPYGGKNQTEAFNEYLDFFKTHSGLLASAIYLNIYDYVDTDWMKLGDGVDYLQGYVTNFTWTKTGNIYYFDLMFKEVTTSV